MDKLHTHYDNLKVTRNAPPEVIRATYKTLSQKYHPDKHLGNADAERVMALINGSYEVLSDPVRRAEHDLWINQQEQETRAHGSSVPRPSAPTPAPEPSAQRRYYQTPAPSQPTGHAKSGLIAHVIRNWLLYGLAGFFLWIWANDSPRKPAPGPKPYQANAAPSVPSAQAPLALPAPTPYQPSQPPAIPEKAKSTATPNGEPWPVGAGYVDGYQQLHANGLSTVTVDNSRNDSEVFVKMVSLDGAQAYPVRQFYIPAFAKFTLEQVTAGSYDIRYRDLSSGRLSRSEPFTLHEVHNNEGAQFSNLTMTLYKVKNGNMKTYGLLETEF